MSSDRTIQNSLQTAIRDKLGCSINANGYVRTPAENLIEGVSLDQFEDDVREGNGNELQMKFCASHSSTALAVNCFAWFKAPGRLQSLALFDAAGANSLRFEYKFPIFRGGTPPNVDVWIERDHQNVAIESKFTEYLVKKKAKEFSHAYDRLSPQEEIRTESCWWQAYQQVKQSESRYLDIAQLVKHYFGLRKYQQRSARLKDLSLLYLYWEPMNWQDVPACIGHRRELVEFAENVSESEIAFKSMSYAQLWQAWSEIPELAQHAENLKNRYVVKLI